MIEDSSKLPNVLADGLSIGTGEETTISLKMSETKRLKAPYGSKCEDSIANEEVKLLYDSDSRYSAKSCNGLCYIVNAINICGCYVAEEVGGIRLDKYNELSGNVSYCNTTEQRECIKIMTVKSNTANKIYDTCDCDPECHGINYKVLK